MSNLPDALARRLGIKAPVYGEDAPQPSCMLDWAIRWAGKGLHLFPCESFTGRPLIERWHKLASVDVSQIADWWSQWPDAHTVIAIIGEPGKESFEALEGMYGMLAPVLSFMSRQDNEFRFFVGQGFSSHEELGPGIHVFGAGRYLYLFPSLTRLAEEVAPECRTANWGLVER
jgi:hypothetical protein